MNHGHIWPEKTQCRLERCNRGLLETPGEQPHVKFLKVRSAMQVARRNRHKINIVRHDFCQFAPIVLSPSVTKRLWQFAQSFFVGLGLRVQGCGEDEEEKTTCQVLHLSFLQKHSA